MSVKLPFKMNKSLNFRKGFRPVDFIPTDIEGLQAWYDASQENYNDGDNVSIWHDLSGNERHAEQSTESKQPEFKTNIFKSQPAINFDGIDDHIFHDMENGFDQPVTYFIVTLKEDVTESRERFITHNERGRSRSSVNSAGLNGFGDLNNELFTFSGTFLRTLQEYDTPFYVIMTSIFNGANSSIIINNKEKIIGDVGNRDIGRRFMIGAHQRQDEDFLVGYLAEIIFYDRKLTDKEINNVNKYLSNKWGVTLEN